jgi:putative transcriptional regulator
MGEQDSYQALMLDYAAGALPAASALLVEAHFELRPEAAEAARAIDMAGGVLLEEILPAATGSPSLTQRERPVQAGPEIGAARKIIGAVAEDMECAPWKRRPLGVRECDLPVQGLTLFRLAGGRSTPSHGHHGDELTLVLHGRLEDELGAYERGDIAFADEELIHRPRVPGGPDCVCLIARAAPTKFLGLLGVAAALWPGPKN